jgi:uracil-DNA glycosylase
MERPSNLKDWAAQGVLLLNATLTTELGHAGKHQNEGWEEVVDNILVELMRRERPLVWILWGRPAQASHARALMALGVTRPLDECIASPHPSPLAAYRGFWGSKPFSKANADLRSRGESEIVW